MSRRRLLINLVLAVLLTAAGAGLWWLMTTEAGLHFAVARVDDLPGIELSADRLSGRLIGPLEVEALEVDLSTVRIVADWAHIDWSPLALLRGHLAFDPVVVRDLRIQLKSRKQPRTQRLWYVAPLSLGLRAKVDGLAIAGVTGNTLFAPERVELEGVIHRDLSISLERLELRHAAGRAEIAGTLGIRPGSPLALDSRWSLQIAGMAAPIQGAGPVRGMLARPELVDHAISAPFQGRLKGSVSWLGLPFAWQGQLSIARADLARLAPGARAIGFSGRVDAHGGAAGLSARAAIDLNDPAAGRWRARAHALHEAGLWSLPELVLTQKDGPGRVQASGMAQIDNARRVEFALAWKELGAPIAGRLVGSPEGFMRVDGHLDDYRITGNAALVSAGLPPGQLELHGQGDRAGLRVEALALSWLGGQIQGGGELRWQAPRRWQAVLRLDDLDPARLAPGFPGRVDAELVAEGLWPENRPASARLHLKRLGGELRGHALAGSGRLAWSDGTLRADDLSVASGSASLSVAGRTGKSWELQFALHAPDLGHFFPGIGGSLDTSGTLSGPAQKPRIALAGRGAGLVWAGRRVARIEMQADADLSGKMPWDIRATAEGIAAGTLRSARLALAANGPPGSHLVVLDASLPGHAFHLEAMGRYETGRWSGQLQRGHYEGADLGRWQQTGGALAQADPAGMRLEALCMQQNAAQVCLGGAGASAQGWRAQANAAEVPLALVNPWLPRRDISLSGRMSGEARMSYRDGLRELAVDLLATGGEFALQTRRDESLKTSYERVALTAQGDGSGLRGRLELALSNGDFARAQALLPGWRPGQALSSDLALNGHIETSLSQLVWISLLAPEVIVPGGRLRVNLALAGTLGSPAVDGTAALEGGEVAIPLLGISLRDLAFQAQSREGSVRLNADARSGEGQLNVNGTLTRTAKGPRLDLRLRGKNVLLLRRPDARLMASPDLELVVEDRRVAIGGILEVPEADINISEIATPVETSPDVVLVGGKEAKADHARWTVTSEVQIVFGDSVRVRGHGFDGRLGGRLTVVEPLRGDAVARGAVEVIEGKYDAYGQHLSIEDGRLLYGSTPLDNPGIEFRAVRQVQDVTVGIIATGRLKTPEVRLYSVPPMDDTQVLAYLVLGRALDTATREEADLLQKAAVSLGLAGGTELAREIAGEFGIDVVQVEADTQRQEASVVLGKYLSPRLYVQYAVGLWEAQDTLRVRYRLTEHWTLEATTGAQTSGADMLYTIEK